MNLKTPLFILIGSLFWYSCAFSQDGSASDDPDVSASQTLPVNYQTADTLRVDIDQKQEMTMSEIFSQIRYLPLERIEEHPIGRIEKITFSENKIFIFEDSTPSVFLYNREGEFLGQIPVPEGKGPGELTWASDMVVDTTAEQISVLGLGRINTYSYSGEVLHEERIGTIPSRFTLLPGGDFVLFMDYYLFKGDGYGDASHNLLYMDREGTMGKQALPIKKSWAMLSYGVNDNFPTYGDRQLFYGSPDHHIYEISADSVAARYYLDFGEYRVPESKYNARTKFNSGADFQMKMLEEGYAYFFRNILETDRVLYFAINTGPRTGVQIFYSKQRKKIFVVDDYPKNNMDHGSGVSFWFRKGNELALHLQAADVIELAEEIKEKLSPEELRAYKQRPENQNLIKLANNMTPMDNPVLMFCKVKQSF